MNTRLFYQILGVCQLLVVQVHIPLRGRNVGMSQQTPSVLDSFLPANLRPALVAGEIQHQVLRQTGQIPKPGIRPAEVGDAPRFPGRGQENRPGLAFPDGLREQLAELPANRNAPGLSGLTSCLVFAQDDGVGRPVNVGDRRPVRR